jgi:A/G-specific adenine glycosylase
MIAKVPSVQTALLDWFEVHRRDLTWRHTRDPYAIMVSEIMLQQTQVDRVLPYWHAWMERWPTVYELAKASVADVIRAWKGLGYNRRAVNLQRAAQAVAAQGGEFPNTVEGLLALPGIGPYTAGAIACFAFEQDVAFIDTNMRRVLHRIFVGVDVPKPTVSDKAVLEIAVDAIPAGQGWTWNQAIMEFGAIHCTAKKPLCMICPVQEECSAFPEIQAALAANTRAPKGKTLPFEQTNRYFRGRILDELRAHEGEGVSLEEIGGAIRNGFSAGDYQWLLELVQALERDGLLVMDDSQPAQVPAGLVAEEPAVYDAVPVEKIRVRLP